MGFISFSFKIMWKPNGLSHSFEILLEQMVGYMLFGKSYLNFQNYIKVLLVTLDIESRVG